MRIASCFNLGLDPTRWNACWGDGGFAYASNAYAAAAFDEAYGVTV